MTNTNPEYGPAIQIIRRAYRPNTREAFVQAMQEQFEQSIRDAGLAFGRAREACENRAEAADWAIVLCATRRWDMLAAAMGSGIIALNEACRVLGIPAHERTAAAVAQWEGN